MPACPPACWAPGSAATCFSSLSDDPSSGLRRPEEDGAARPGHIGGSGVQSLTEDVRWPRAHS